MSSTATAPVIRLSVLAASECDTDLLVVPLFDGEAASALHWLDPATDNEVGAGYAMKELRIPAANARSDANKLADIVEGLVF